MKRRKRKMSLCKHCTGFLEAAELSATKILTLMLLLTSATCSNFDHQDDEHHKLNESLLANSSASLELRWHNQAAGEREEEDQASGLISGENALDDLLALETTRLLTIGRQASAPYASNQSTSTSRGATSTNLEPQDELQVTKVHHSPPTKASLGGPSSRREFRNSLAGSKGAAEQRQRQLLPANPAPHETWPGLYFLQSRVGRPLISTAPPAQGGWSSYAEFVHNKTASQGHRSAQTDGGDRPTAANKLTASTIEYDESRTSGNTSDRKHFPKLVSSQLSEEDAFERGLSLGNYQRTDASNMNWTQLLRQATENNVMESLMITNKTMVSLLCDTNEMLLRLKFKQPFRGMVATNADRSGKSCRLYGNGGLHYEFRVALYECGTRQETPRLFVNNIQIQFHQSLDLAEDEVKTIICSYPIRPRAPPPPQLPQRPSERIVEAPSEPAKLVHYEPLFLISGLLLLSLSLLGLTASAYMFTRRRRSGENLSRFSSRSGGFASTRIYRNQPSWPSNRLLAPPTISVGTNQPQAGETTRLAGSLGPKERRGAEAPAGGATNPKLPPKSQLPRVSMNPDESSDSLADKNDGSSITTIEIPFSNKVKAAENFTAPSEQRPTQQAGAAKGAEKSVGRPIHATALVASTTNKSPNGSAAPTKTVPKNSRLPALERVRVARPTKQPREASTGRGQDQTHLPRFGSLRATLTSPEQYQRLQEIANMFKEVRQEDHKEEGSDRVIVFKTRLIPSKYRRQIMDRLDTSERQKIRDALWNDEVFRSHIVDSVSRDIFRRKLRENPVYMSKFKPETWNLLEEIALDPGLSSSSGEDSASAAQTQLSDSSDSSDSSSSMRREPNTSQLAESHEKAPSVSGSSSQSVEPGAYESEIRSSMSHLDSLDFNPNTRQSYAELKTLPDSKDQLKAHNDASSKSMVRVSQFNSTKTKRDGGLTGTLINIDSVTNFAGSKDFSTYLRSSIKHTSYESPQDESLAFVNESVGSYEYAKEAYRLSPNLKETSLD